jgi:hypothetical protein
LRPCRESALLGNTLSQGGDLKVDALPDRVAKTALGVGQLVPDDLP